MKPYKNPNSIKYWAEDDQPREKLILKGRKALSDAELIAILLGSGTKQKSAVELAREILQAAANNIDDLAKFSLPELMQFKGIGQAKAVSIVAALELGRRRKDAEPKTRKRMLISEDAVNVLKAEFTDLQQEEFWVLYLDTANKLIKKEMLSSGGINQTVVDLRILMKKTLENLATGIILAHNHPSGRLIPSTQDVVLTKKIIEACKVFDIHLQDHIIFGPNGNFFSFRDENYLRK